MNISITDDSLKPLIVANAKSFKSFSEFERKYFGYKTNVYHFDIENESNGDLPSVSIRNDSKINKDGNLYTVVPRLVIKMEVHTVPKSCVEIWSRVPELVERFNASRIVNQYARKIGGIPEVDICRKLHSGHSLYPRIDLVLDAFESHSTVSDNMVRIRYVQIPRSWYLPAQLWQRIEDGKITTTDGSSEILSPIEPTYCSVTTLWLAESMNQVVACGTQKSVEGKIIKYAEELFS
jgi:hypothetical protein